MDDLDDLQASEFVTDTEDQDSLDERIETEQRLRNHQLWASFQNAACCITKLYNDRNQPNISPWVPFQNAASNLTTLYKDCIESQKRFARIGYQVGRRRRQRDMAKLLKKHKIPAKQLQAFTVADNHSFGDLQIGASHEEFATQEQHNISANHMQLQSPPQSSTQQQNSNSQLHLGNTEEDLVTFQQALVQPTAIKGAKSNQNRRQCLNTTQAGYHSRTIDSKAEEERLIELNQFLAEEYHRHVGSRKRSCSNTGGNIIKRHRE